MPRTDLAIALLSPLVIGCSHGSSAEDSGPPPSAPVAASASTTTTAAPTPPPFVRPSLVARSGSYFSWLQPADWKANETSNGVDLTSPDGSIIANSVCLVGAPGASDPWTFIQTTLTAIGEKDLQQTKAENLPPEPSGYPGINYDVKAFEATFTDQSGNPRKAAFTVGVCSAFGAYSAALQSFSTPPDGFEQGKTWIPMLCDSVKAIDPSRVANQNQVLLARNHPLDNTPLMESWAARRASQDHIAQEQHETTMGYERMVSPIDGQHYDMPFEAYDSVKGGYHDPANPLELLKHAPPGE